MGKSYTVKEVAEYFQVSPSTIRRLIKEGELKAYRISKAIRIAPEQFYEFKLRCLCNDIELDTIMDESEE
jgi:excisionase family DNA binding protein